MLNQSPQGRHRQSCEPISALPGSMQVSWDCENLPVELRIFKRDIHGGLHVRPKLTEMLEKQLPQLQMSFRGREKMFQDVSRWEGKDEHKMNSGTRYWSGIFKSLQTKRFFFWLVLNGK